MKRLAPDLFDRRFSDLVEMGRARLPGLAPDWTDYNAHDPGITLMELLAWVTEAQLYSLGRMRRDERAAYAALFGLARGRHAARARPDLARSARPARAGRDVYAEYRDRRRCRREHAGRRDADVPARGKAAVGAGRVRRLDARLADGRVVDYTVINERGGPAFQPFGAARGTATMCS